MAATPKVDLEPRCRAVESARRALVVGLEALIRLHRLDGEITQLAEQFPDWQARLDRLPRPKGAGLDEIEVFADALRWMDVIDSSSEWIDHLHQEIGRSQQRGDAQAAG
jgi:hypothetical protein